MYFYLLFIQTYFGIVALKSVPTYNLDFKLEWQELKKKLRVNDYYRYFSVIM